jgi:CubicO group peptidase (beta-lactamase class C family)
MMSSGGLSETRLARVRDVMAGSVEREELPGIVTLIARRGEVHVHALGTKSLGGNNPVERDTIFRISSMTKPITAAATMILVEECMLRLDDPVDPLLPELANRQVLKQIDGPLDDTVPAHRPITVRDLLTFCQGFGLVMAPPDSMPILRAQTAAFQAPGPPGPATVPAPDEWISALGTLPLVYQPGERWMYNTGSDVLGVLIARASGQPFETFLRERIFDPLGMSDTGFFTPAPAIDRLADSYTTDPDTEAVHLYDQAAGGQWSRPPAFPSGAGGLVSTVDDYGAFAQMMLQKGEHAGARLISRPSVDTMTVDHLTAAQKSGASISPGYFDSHGWGFGMSVITRRDTIAGSVGSFGWDGGLGTSWFSDPREDMTVILLTQRAWTSPTPPKVCLDFWTSAYAAIDD